MDVEQEQSTQGQESPADLFLQCRPKAGGETRVGKYKVLFAHPSNGCTTCDIGELDHSICSLWVITCL